MRLSQLRSVPSAVLRAGLLSCICLLLTSTGVAQCTNPVQVPNQTISSGTATIADNNALRAEQVVVNGSASVMFAAGNCIELAPGFRATAGSAATTFHALVEATPSADSAAPSSGSGLAQAFTFNASSASGYNDVSDVLMLVNTVVSGVNACYMKYNRASNLLYLTDNQATAWLGGITPGSAARVSNSQCSIDGVGSSVAMSGTRLTVTVAVTFQYAFAGAKNEYLYVLNNEGLKSGWQQMGTWTVPAQPPLPPDFEVSSSRDTAAVLPGYIPTVSFPLSIKPLNGFNEALNIAAPTFFGCAGGVIIGPLDKSNPIWTTTVTVLGCSEPVANKYASAILVQNPSLAIQHQIPVYLWVTQTQKYYLSTSAVPAGGGSIATSQPGPYDALTLVTVTAQPNAGYSFSGFSGDLSGSSPGSIMMNSNKSVTANFTQSTVTQTITSVPAGRSLTVDSVACQAPCTRQWAAGTSHTVGAANQSGGTGTLYVFSNWSDSGASSHSITVPSSSVTYTATFATQYLLSTSAATGGSISPAPPGAWYTSGALVPITATAATGYQFAGFSGALGGTGTPQSVTVNGPLSVGATFTSIATPDFTLTTPAPVTVSTGGTGQTSTTVTPVNGFSSAVTLSVHAGYSLPAGVTVSFQPGVVAAGSGSSNVTITSTTATPSGTYSIPIDAVAGSIAKSSTIALTVASPREYIWSGGHLIAVEQ